MTVKVCGLEVSLEAMRRHQDVSLREAPHMKKR